MSLDADSLYYSLSLSLKYASQCRPERIPAAYYRGRVFRAGASSRLEFVLISVAIHADQLAGHIQGDVRIGGVK